MVRRLSCAALWVLCAVLLIGFGASPAEAQFPQTCTSHGCSIDMTSATYALNNHWNLGNASGGQSITVHSPTSWSTTWDWNRTDEWTVTTYAATITGWNWGWHFPPSQTGLPVQLASRTPVNASVAFDYRPDSSCSVSRTCRIDIAYDVWITDTSTPGDVAVMEMMVWLAYSRELWNGYPTVGTPTIGGHRWKVIRVGGYVAFLLDEPADLSSATLNIMDFATWLVNNQAVPSSWWISSVMFGPEVLKGRGTMNVTSYTINVGGSSGGTSSPPPPSGASFAVGTTTVTPGQVAPSQGAAITTQVTAASAASNIHVDVEIYNASNQQVAQYILSGQSFSAGQTRSYTWNWPGISTAGSYMVKVGVFSGDWNTNYVWDGDAAPFSVGGTSSPSSPPPPTGGSFTVGTTTVSPGQVPVGQGASITTQITAANAASNTNIDLEIYDASNTQIAQHIVSGQSFSAGQTRTYTWNWPGTGSEGSYMVRIGVFSGDWNTNYVWDGDAAPFSVGGAASAFVVKATGASPDPVTRGKTLTVKTSVQAAGATTGVRVLLEIYSPTGVRVAQKSCTQNFTAGQTNACSWSYVVPRTLARGIYSVSVGVFNNDWTQLHTWVSNADTFTVK